MACPCDRERRRDREKFGGSRVGAANERSVRYGALVTKPCCDDTSTRRGPPWIVIGAVLVLLVVLATELAR
jgi:hypothetical protein